VVCRVGKGNDDGDGGVQNGICGRKFRPRSAYPAEQPIYAEHRPKGGRYRVWNGIEVLLV